MLQFKKIAITNLQGGLGNQMFQYAVARATGYKVYFDLQFLKNNSVSVENFTARSFELSIFKNINAKEISAKYFNFIKSKFYKKVFRLNFRIINQTENEFVDINTKSSNLYLNGYFQSEKYFSNYRAKILDDFMFPALDTKNKLIESQIKAQSNSVSIHIRRGDYIKSKAVLAYHGVLPLFYYEVAINKLKEKYNNDIQLYFFSDDINFIKQNFGKYPNSVIVEGNTNQDSWKDMALMSACKHHIIANSSFSWWGAWLGGLKGITYAPRHFFSPKVNYNIDDYIPSSWTIVDYDFE